MLPNILRKIYDKLNILNNTIDYVKSAFLLYYCNKYRRVNGCICLFFSS